MGNNEKKQQTIADAKQDLCNIMNALTDEDVKDMISVLEECEVLKTYKEHHNLLHCRNCHDTYGPCDADFLDMGECTRRFNKHYAASVAEETKTDEGCSKEDQGVITTMKKSEMKGKIVDFLKKIGFFLEVILTVALFFGAREILFLYGQTPYGERDALNIIFHLCLLGFIYTGVDVAKKII